MSAFAARGICSDLFELLLLETTAEHWGSGADHDARGSILRLGATWILLKEATSPEESQRLARHGQGPCQITLLCHDGAISPGAVSSIDTVPMSGAGVALA